MVRMNSRKWARLYCVEALKGQKGACLYCKEPITAARATADHLHPQSRGGQTNKNNIAAACRSCNQAKGDMHEGRFFKIISSKEPPKSSDLMLVWASRRIWRRTHRAVQRIRSASGILAA